MDTMTVKKEICEIGRRLYDCGFAISNDGNISVKISDDEIWATPTGVSKGYMTEDMLVCVNSKGEIISGGRNPSSEIKMHLKVYEMRKDINAVVHAHPPLATAFAVCHTPLDKHYLTEAVVGIGEVKVAAYATPSTDEVPNSIVPFLHDSNAVLLANHGALTWDETLLGAFFKLQTVEFLAQLSINVKQIGNAKELSKEHVEQLIGMRDFYKNYVNKK